MRKIKYLLMMVALMTCCTASFAQSKTTKGKKATTTYRKKATTAKRKTTTAKKTTTTAKPKTTATTTSTTTTTTTTTTTQPVTTTRAAETTSKPAKTTASTDSHSTSWRMDVPTWKGFRVSFDHTFMSNKAPKPELQDDLGQGDDDYGYIGSMNGLSVGYVQAIKLSPAIPLFLEFGGELSYAKWSWSGDYYDGPDGREDDPQYHYDITQSATAVSVRIPVNVVYAFKLNNNMILKPYSGMFLRVYASSKYKYEDTDYEGETSDYSVNLFKKSDFEDDKEFYDNNHWNRLVLGWTMGCNLDINEHFNVGLDFSYDTSRISKGIRSSRLSLKAGYNL